MCGGSVRAVQMDLDKMQPLLTGHRPGESRELDTFSNYSTVEVQHRVEILIPFLAKANERKPHLLNTATMPETSQ